MSWLPLLCVVALFFFFNRLKKVPAHVQPIPAVEIECPRVYDLKIAVNGRPVFELVHGMDVRAHNLVLKTQSSKSEYEILLDLSNVISFDADEVTFEVEYKHNGQDFHVIHVSPKLELDYAIAYVENEKLLRDSEISEQYVALEEAGKETVIFTGLRDKAITRDSRIRKK